LRLEESAAEKVRAAFQRSNARDIYDLYQYGQLVFNPELVRMAAVLKCWQDRGLYSGATNFDPAEFLAKLITANYAWDALKDQVAPHAWVEPNKKTILRSKIDPLSYTVGNSTSKPG
jgi:predicted nucleotidyltransferase component of viral defense system